AAIRLLYFPPATAPAGDSRFSDANSLFPPPAWKPCRLSFSLRLQKSSKLQLSTTLLPAESGVDSVTGEENAAEEDEISRTRLLVQNVPWTCTADDIQPLFENYGSVIEIEFSMYNKTRNRGLAFVTMASHEEALAALNSLESTEFEGRVLKLNWAKPKKEKNKTGVVITQPLPVHNLFVANLPFEARPKDLKDFFNAVSAEVIYNENPRRPAGYGFVSFYTKEEADAALTSFQAKEFMGRPIRVARSKRFLREGTKAAIQLEN
ncbi:hypothetical protein M569_04668, partial [Genlisea aurea]